MLDSRPFQANTNILELISIGGGISLRIFPTSSSLSVFFL